MVYLFSWEPRREVCFSIHRDSAYSFLPDWTLIREDKNIPSLTEKNLLFLEFVKLLFREKPNPAAPSCVSLKSNRSMAEPIYFNDRPPADDPRVKFFSSESSCRSMKSEPSLNKPMEFKERKR
ncbi:hypothetical protein DNTS_018975 [Danionella cerebrum]|uniref:Uncharacterized protein n=1 Tax=Danionella cerebrum TaxID=2873325 RepID=A0A553QP17_9TELE|nr:hypothetical protein DNTS_018975 [Danionella translucida]